MLTGLAGSSKFEIIPIPAVILNLVGSPLIVIAPFLIKPVDKSAFCFIALITDVGTGKLRALI